jgi:serine/threonine-protein kinase
VRICPQCGSEYDAEIKFCPKDGTTLRVPPGAALIGAVIADRYHIIKKLGEGGMGQVFLAEHVKMGRPSAIKVMTPGMMQDADAISRFNREAANASRITHPNVAAIYDFGETSDGLIYLAMEYVEGSPLTSIVEQSGTLPPARAASIIRQTASALDAAHERGIIHRDLKPDNIMIARNRDGSDLVKVVDFGIAKSAHGTGQKVTKTGLVVGTPEYMSPEQLAGDAVDARSDTFALALVAFHILTGKLPYAEGSAQETMIRRLTDRPRTLAETRPGVAWPPALESVMERGLNRESSGRPASSGEFAAAFAGAVEGMAPIEGDVDGATKVIGAVPATRVARASAPSTRPSTAVTPARGKSRGLLIGGGVVAAAIIAGAVVMRSGQKGAGPVTGAATQNFQKAMDSAAQHDTTPPAADTKTAIPATKVETVRVAARPSPPAAHTTAPAPKPAAPPSAPPPAPVETTVNDAAQANAEVQRAAQLIVNDHPDAALVLLRKAMPNLATKQDSVTGWYHISEALLQHAEKHSDSAAKGRACDILERIRKDKRHPDASGIASLYDLTCK